jgi:pilus assembly protein TadC
MVAGLPLVMLLLLPAARVPLFDIVGIVAITSRFLLAVAGMKWMTRLVPSPTGEPPAAAVADRMAALLEGGLPLAEAASACVTRPPAELAGQLESARRRVALGCSWANALARSDDRSLARLGSRLVGSQSLGVPAARALRIAADSQRRDADTAFDAALRRAPVLMVVPLVICVLPSFCLIGLVPFMRGFSLR